MKRTFIRNSFFACLVTLVSIVSTLAQTISQATVTPAAVCVGGSVAVAFTVTGGAVGATYTAQISDASGSFTTPVATATGTTSPINVVVPATAPTGVGYKARIVLTTPSVTGAASADFAVNAIPGAPTTIAAISYVEGATATALAATPASGATLNWYDESDAPLVGAPTPTTTAAGSQIFKVSQTVGGCESTKAVITVTVTACTPPVAPTATSPVTYTVGQVATALKATGTGNFHWYTEETGGDGTTVAPIPSTETADTTSYWVSQSTTANSCESLRAKIDVVVSCATVAKPTVSSIAPVCKDVTVASSVLTAAVIPKTGLLWYAAATGGTGSATVPVVVTTMIGPKNYYVSQTVNGCESDRSIVVVEVKALPASPRVENQNYAFGAVAKKLTADGNNLKWYSSGDTLLLDAPVPTTTAAGTQTYKVTQTVSGCESAKAVIKVTVSACVLSAEPTVTSPLSYCASTTNPAALVASGIAIKWYNASNGLLTSAPIPNANVTTTTTTTYYVTQTQAGKCESAKKEVIITVNKTPAPTVSSVPVEFCVGETATPLQATGTALKWYNTTTGSTTISSTPLTTTAGNQIFYVSQTLNGCESERARIDVKVIGRPATPTVTDLASVCQNTIVASTALTAAVTQKTGLLWYAAATGGTGLATAPTIVTSASGQKNYYVTQTVNGCESTARAEISQDVKPLPLAPAVTPVEYCKDIKATPLTVNGTGLKWYANPTVTTTITVPTPSTATVGTVSYYVSQSQTHAGTPALVCESPRAKIDVKTNALPPAPAAFSDALCQDREEKTFTFAATPSAGNSIVWYKNATGSDLGTTSVNLKNAGEVTVYAVQKTTATGCESPARTAYKMKVKALPAQPTIPDQKREYCQFDAAEPLKATLVAGASPNWYGTNATGGTSSGVAPSPSTADGGTTSYYVAQTLEGCLGDRSKIDVKINTTPKPITTTYLEYCQGVQAPRLDATGSILKWYRQATDTEWQGYPYTPFTEKVEDYSFWVTQTGANTCESPKEEIKIHIKAKPSATISGSTAINLGETAAVTLNFTSDGPWKYILSSGDTGTATQSPIVVKIKEAPITTTTYFVTEVSNECGKGSPSGSAQITVKVPTIITGTPSVAEACAGSSFTVPFQQSGDFAAGNTFKVQISLTNEEAGFYTVPSVPGTNTIVATFPDTTQGGHYLVRVVSVGANPAFMAKGSINSLGITAIPRPVATITGTQTVLIGSPATMKVDITGNAPWKFSLFDGTKDSVITATASPYTFLVSPKVTTTYSISTVSNVCGAGKGVGSARVQVDPILGVEPAITDWVKVYPTMTSTECTVELTTGILNKNAKVQIIDLNGRPVFEQGVRQKVTQLNFTQYPAGLYLIRVDNGNLSSVIRVVKP